MKNEPAVRFRSAAAAVGGRTVWAGVDFTVDAGQFVAVLGPNGAGKSTLLKTILGLVPVSSGTITVFGRNPGHDRSTIGYLPQRHAFGSSVRIRGTDIVRLGLDGERWGTPLPSWLLGRKGRAATARVRETIRLVGAEGYANRPIGQCSGGEQQRLLIAQALVRRPKLLVLDEPLDSLDVTNQRSVSALIQGVCRSEGVTVLMVAHDVNPILPYLDQVVYLGHGSAITGTPEQVITPEALTALYSTPVDVLRDRAGRLVVIGQPDAPPEHPHGPQVHA